MGSTDFESLLEMFGVSGGLDSESGLGDEPLYITGVTYVLFCGMLSNYYHAIEQDGLSNTDCLEGVAANAPVSPYQDIIPSASVSSNNDPRVDDVLAIYSPTPSKAFGWTARRGGSSSYIILIFSF